MRKKNKQNLKKTEINGKTIQMENPHDGGAIFKNQSGFAIEKKGNYGMEPVLRGFKYSQLNVQFDGGVHSANACPNRMDPTISQISPEEIEKIELIKGPYDVRFQSFGGLINIVSKRPAYNPDKAVNAHIDLGYISNGNSYYANIFSQYAGKKAYFSINAGYKDYGSYESGDGRKIPSSFLRWSYTLKGGYYISKKQRLQITFRQSQANDILYAGLPMDADFDKSSIASADYLFSDVSKTIKSIKVKLYASMVDHEMSSRKRTSWKMIEAVSPVQSQVYGGRTEFLISSGKKNNIYSGIDFKQIAKQGVRNRKVIINPCTGDSLPIPLEIVDKTWQDSRKNEFGVFVENHYEINKSLSWWTGLRVNRVSYDILDPADDFKEFYNNDIQVETKILPAISSRLNWYVNENTDFQWAIGMSQRSPDLHELYIDHFSIGMDAYEYLGNPDLKPETNYQTDVSLEYDKGKFKVYGDVFYSYLNNYISAALDTSIHKKFMPCNPPYGTKVFTNIEKAFMTGFEAGAEVKFLTNFSLSLSGAYTYAQNLSLDEALPEIPPFTVNSFVAFENKKLTSRIHARFAAAQNRVSNSFGESTTPSFSVVDWFISYSPMKLISISASVTNIFDLNYVEHLSRSYKNMGTESGSLYYEPGRSFNVGLRLNL